MKTRRHIIALTLTAFAAAVAPWQVQAASYPERPVRILVGFPAGGPADIAARIIAEGLQKKLGQVFVVENRTGASGVIAAQAVAKSVPDGYTLLVSTNSLTLNAITTSDAGYRPETDFVPISLLATQASAIAVNPKLQVKTVGELKAFATRHKMSFATSGQGTSSQMIGVYLFNTLWKTDMAAVPYRGAGPADVAVASGEPPVGFTTVGGAVRLQQDGRVRILAIANARRLPNLPDVPTMSELGYDNFNASWTGLLGPAGMPPGVVEKLNAAVNAILRDPQVKEKFELQSMDIPEAKDTHEVARYMASESVTWRHIVEATGLSQR